jgi:hypothetical protein
VRGLALADLAGDLAFDEFRRDSLGGIPAPAARKIQANFPKIGKEIPQSANLSAALY